MNDSGRSDVSTVYFKTRFPRAKITVVEADPGIVSNLTSNVGQVKFKDVTLLNADVGRLSMDPRLAISTPGHPD